MLKHGYLLKVNTADVIVRAGRCSPASQALRQARGSDTISRTPCNLRTRNLSSIRPARRQTRGCRARIAARRRRNHSTKSRYGRYKASTCHHPHCAVPARRQSGDRTSGLFRKRVERGFSRLVHLALCKLHVVHAASLQQFSTALSVHMLMFDMNQPPSQGSSSGSSGNHQPCWAETTWGMMPESSLAR